MYGGRHRKSWTDPNPNFGRRPQLYRQSVIRDLSEESWRPGLSVPTSVDGGGLGLMVGAVLGLEWWVGSVCGTGEEKGRENE